MVWTFESVPQCIDCGRLGLSWMRLHLLYYVLYLDW
jgi:hypothetical protein